MADNKQFMYSHQDLAKILIKESGIHEGTWSVAIEFKMAATMVGEDAESVLPSGVVGVSRIGIQETSSENVLAVDAAVVNPRPITRPATRKKL